MRITFLPLAHAFLSCPERPSGLATLSPSDFSGLWVLTQSTFEKPDRTGCATWQVVATDSGLEVTSSANNIFTWNIFEKGKQTSSKQ